MRNTVLVAITLVCVTGLAHAKAKYIKDELVVPVTEGQGKTTAILKTIKSGERIEILEETEAGYSRVKTSDGTEGWVRTQYISDEPTAAQKLAKVQDKMTQLDTSNQAMKKELKDIRAEKTKLEETLNKLQSDHNNARKELDHLGKVAAQPLALDKENREMRERHDTMKHDLEMLRNEYQIVKDRSRQNWFMAGAGVIILGMLLGLMIPKLRLKRKSGWDY